MTLPHLIQELKERILKADAERRTAVSKEMQHVQLGTGIGLATALGLLLETETAKPAPTKPVSTSDIMKLAADIHGVPVYQVDIFRDALDIVKFKVEDGDLTWCYRFDPRTLPGEALPRRFLDRVDFFHKHVIEVDC